MREYTEKEQEQLAGLLRDIERVRLEKKLKTLSEKFAQWNSGKLSTKKLAAALTSHCLQEGSNPCSEEENLSPGASKNPGLLVAKALINGELKHSQVPAELRDTLEAIAEVMRL